MRRVLIIRALVGLDPNPYTQVARESDGTFYCEVVSSHHLPASTWPIDEAAFVADGWEPPVGRHTNWSVTAESGYDAAQLLIDALRYGRGCGDPETFVGTIGRWPSPPDDDEHEPPGPPDPFDLAA